MLGLVRTERGAHAHGLPAAKRWVPAIQQASGRLFLLCLVGFTILGCLTGGGEWGCVDETRLRQCPLVCIEVWSDARAQGKQVFKVVLGR